MTICTSCGKVIVFLAHYETGKNNPIEANPAKDGNLVINRERGIYRFATNDEKETAKTQNKNLYVSHFASCKSAKEFRRK